MGNIFIRTDPVGNVKENKKKFPEKIEGVIFTIMALDMVLRSGMIQVNLFMMI